MFRPEVESNPLGRLYSRGTCKAYYLHYPAETEKHTTFVPLSSYNDGPGGGVRLPAGVHGRRASSVRGSGGQFSGDESVRSGLPLRPCGGSGYRNAPQPRPCHRVPLLPRQEGHGQWILFAGSGFGGILFPYIFNAVMEEFTLNQGLSLSFPFQIMAILTLQVSFFGIW